MMQNQNQGNVPLDLKVSGCNGPPDPVDDQENLDPGLEDDLKDDIDHEGINPLDEAGLEEQQATAEQERQMLEDVRFEQELFEMEAQGEKNRINAAKKEALNLERARAQDLWRVTALRTLLNEVEEGQANVQRDSRHSGRQRNDSILRARRQSSAFKKNNPQNRI